MERASCTCQLSTSEDKDHYGLVGLDGDGCLMWVSHEKQSTRKQTCLLPVVAVVKYKVLEQCIRTYCYCRGIRGPELNQFTTKSPCWAYREILGDIMKIQLSRVEL